MCRVAVIAAVVVLAVVVAVTPVLTIFSSSEEQRNTWFNLDNEAEEEKESGMNSVWIFRKWNYFVCLFVWNYFVWNCLKL